MGIGDEIMVSGEVRKLVLESKNDALRVAVWSAKYDKQRWDDIWRGNPNIAEIGQAYETKIYNHGGNRPYIAQKGPSNWTWKKYKPIPGRIILFGDDMSFADEGTGCVVIQTSVKANASPNKLWPIANWKALVESMPSVHWLQIGAGHELRVPGVKFVRTATFREACGVLRNARCAVLQEGGLHHAAAALGTPAVVIFGGYISPQCTGYDLHRNLYFESAEYPLGCGSRVFCPHCIRAMNWITVKRVREQLEALLDERIEA